MSAGFQEESATRDRKTRRRITGLKVCTKNHGGPGNAATVYGHPGSVRVCIRLHNTNTWVYDPGWEKR
jgi:hypothetical protein